MKIDRSWLIAHRSQKGGWNSHQLEALGVQWPPTRGWINRVCETEYTEEQIAKFLKNGLNGPRNTSEAKRIRREARKQRRRELRQEQFQKRVQTFRKKDEFLVSYEWRVVRMQVLKRDGAKCACCGATPADGRVMNVDHIKNRRDFPSLALDLNNLQVLCDECNHGKSNWDSTDWRESSIGVKLRVIK